MLEKFTVSSYKINKRLQLVDCATNSTESNISGMLLINNCEQTPPQIQGTMSYEALKLVRKDSIHIQKT